jgi:hypothetical protein
MGAEAAIDRTQRHPTGEAVGDKHAVAGIGREARHTALWRRPLGSAPQRTPPAATPHPRLFPRAPGRTAALLACRSTRTWCRTRRVYCTVRRFLVYGSMSLLCSGVM